MLIIENKNFLVTFFSRLNGQIEDLRKQLVAQSSSLSNRGTFYFKSIEYKVGMILISTLGSCF